MKKLYLFTVLLTLAGTSRTGNDAFCFIGGLNSTYGNLGNVPRTIRDTYPKIPFVELKNGNGTQEATKRGVYQQLTDLYHYASAQQILTNRDVILIGASQGGLLAQAFVEMYGDKLPFKIIGLITLASPLAGQFGLPDYWERIVDEALKSGSKLPQEIVKSFDIDWIPIAIKDNAIITIGEAIDPTKSMLSAKIFDRITTTIKKALRADMSLMRFIFYNPIGLELFSIAGYWKDPMHMEEYLAGNGFLPLINNEKMHPDYARYKANILALKRVVLFWSGRDETVMPSCSGSKRFFKKGSKTEVEKSFEDTDQYKSDLLGLKTMLHDGRLFIEYLEHDNHSCDSQEAVEKALEHVRAIIKDQK